MNPSVILLALFAAVFTNQPQFPENSLYGTWKQEQKISENLTYVGLTTYKPDGTFIALVDKRQNTGIDEKIEIQGNWNINKNLFSAIGKQKSGESITDFSVQCDAP